jgi:hypothetical protein
MYVIFRGLFGGGEKEKILRSEEDRSMMHIVWKLHTGGEGEWEYNGG